VFLLGQKGISCQEDIWTLAAFDQLFSELSFRPKL